MRLFSSRRDQSTDALLAAVMKTQAVIEFDMDGKVLTANDNFLSLLGYTLGEIKGKHHSMFVSPQDRESPDYALFWSRLRSGKADISQYKRIGKGGKEVWIEASYNPILDSAGKPCKVVKFAMDVTAQKMELSELKGQSAAIDKALAVISFSLDGTILDANANFLRTVGYTLAEVKGKHHRMFVDPASARGPEYAEFWKALKQGQYCAGQYKRIGKGGREIWLEASYNPILDPDGKPYKVVKFATNITEQVKLLGSLKDLIDVNFGDIDRALAKSDDNSSEAVQAAAMASSNVQTIAAAAEELAASITEISSSMTKSQTATDSAFHQTVSATDATKRLTDAASAMGGIVTLIQNIAGQINLLALNATIESARAGEAGRGFAVVANEVKNLANQAAQATEKISKEINTVQTISEEVVDSLETICQSIESVREHVSTTAAAVEEQSAVTGSMSANMQGAATAVTTVSENINTIVASIIQVSGAVSKTKEAAHVLAR